MSSGIKTLGIVLLLALGLEGCKKDYKVDLPRPTSTIVSEGYWRVISLQANGIEYRDKFATYQFKFDNGGSVIAFDKSAKTEGRWWSGWDRDHYAFVIEFPVHHELLEKISSNWTLVKQTSDNLELKDFNDDSDGTEYLVLRKI